MSGISTHVLDLARGRPAAGVAVLLERDAHEGEGARAWREVARAVTDGDGRAVLLPRGAEAPAGTYRLTFALAPYLEAGGATAFFPEAAIVFARASATEHHHVPLLLSPFGYTTYRGS